MTLAANPPIEIPLERMTGAQKWELFNALWDDLSSKTDMEDRSPAWHGEILQERLKREERGEAVWHDVDEAFENLRRKLT